MSQKRLLHYIFWVFVAPNILSICLTKYFLPSKASVEISSLLNASSGILASYTRVSLKIPPFVFHTTVFTVKWPQPFLLNQKVNLNIKKGIRRNMSETYAFWLRREKVSHLGPTWTKDLPILKGWSPGQYVPAADWQKRVTRGTTIFIYPSFLEYQMWSGESGSN